MAAQVDVTLQRYRSERSPVPVKLGKGVPRDHRRAESKPLLRGARCIALRAGTELLELYVMRGDRQADAPPNTTPAR